MGVILDIQNELLLEPLAKALTFEPRYIEWTVTSVGSYLRNAEVYRIALPVQQALETMYEYAISVMGVMVSLMNAMTMSIYFDLNAIADGIEPDLTPFWAFALDTMGFRYDEVNGTFTMLSTGLLGKIHGRQVELRNDLDPIIKTTIPALEKRLGELEDSIGEITPEMLEKIVLVANNIDAILEFMENGVGYLIGEVQEGLMNLVQGYVDPQINMITTNLESLWVEVRRYGNVFVDVILALINILLTGVQIPADQIENIMESIHNWIEEEVNKQLSEIRTTLTEMHTVIYTLPEWWITALKKKLVI